MHVWTDITNAATRALLTATLGVLAVGCTTSPSNVIRQGEGPTVLEIMRGEHDVDEARASSAASERGEARHQRTELVRAALVDSNNEGYTRDSVNEIRNLFPTLPNRTISLYVEPHLVREASTGEFLPVPGYSTAFPLYSRVQFALPSEMPATRSSETGRFPAGRASDTGTPFADTDIKR